VSLVEHLACPVEHLAIDLIRALAGIVGRRQPCQAVHAGKFLANHVRAQQHGAGRRLDVAGNGVGKHALAGPRTPADRNQGRLARSDQLQRQRKVGFRVGDAGGIAGTEVVLGERHQRADRSADGEEQRQQHQRIAVLAPAGLQIEVEQPVCRGALAEVHEVHDRKGEVVEQVGRRNHRIELDGVEQDRFAVDHDDIGEIGVAMAAPHEAGRGTPLQQREKVVQAPVAEFMQPIDIAGRHLRLSAKPCSVAIDDGPDRGQPLCAICDRCTCMRGTHGFGQFAGRIGWDGMRRGEVVERAGFVEPRHLHRPFDRRPFAVKRKAIRFAGDGNDPAIDFRCIAGVDR
jgi:hypothetical protein